MLQEALERGELKPTFYCLFYVHPILPQNYPSISVGGSYSNVANQMVNKSNGDELDRNVWLSCRSVIYIHYPKVSMYHRDKRK